ncbi:DUF3800 domain-containing protein [uncultured Friedmanniella sp.]|uniref:DUF3800 domain-containing protein n=1 Tax=uncultured Friedmanniella sp. TaxID=335381 RepID=UPI0035CC727F
MATRLFYMDDSGHHDTGWAVYAWVEVDVTEWRDGLRPWLDFRRRLDEASRIPVTYELHMTRFLGTSERPSRDPEWNTTYENRWAVVADALDVVAATPCLSVGAVHRHTEERRKSYRREQADLYRRLVGRLDDRLTAAGDIGIIVMDGDGTDESYVTAHRELKLATRSIIEDPLFQNSHRNQWVQIADLVAYTAYQSLLRAPAKRFAWDWYADHLATTDPEGGPQAL